MKYVIATLPRSGSFLACQLLEEYLVKKYGYHRLPFFEFISKSSIVRNDIPVTSVINNGEIKIEPKIDLSGDHTELRQRLSRIKQQEDSGILYLNKLIYKTSPEYAFQYYRKHGYTFIYLERQNMLEQLVSNVLAQQSRIWHNTDSERNFTIREPIDRTFKQLEFHKNIIEERIFTQYQFRMMYGWTNYKIVTYEHFATNYDRFFTLLGVDDYKEYLPNFDFVQSKPMEKQDITSLIKNYDEVVGWVSELTNEINNNDFYKGWDHEIN